MTIKTITCHDVYNYGASLQAYALMRYLETQGHDVEIIDYLPEYLTHHYEFWYIPEDNRFHTICQKHWLLHLLYSIRLIPVTYRTWRRIKPFKKFKKQYFRLTERYSSYEELKNNPPVADLYIAGSDQIWNCIVRNGNDPAFYLNFGDEKARRISYAASFAISVIPEEKRKAIKHFLTVLDSISVRETSGLRILESLGYEGRQVLDPVFLLPAEQWLSFAGSSPVIEGNYLLVYNLFPGNLELNTAVDYIAKRDNLKIIAINDSSKYAGADINVSDAGPIEFVNLIAYARYVVCDSFHGTAFSVIFNKQFAVYYKNINSSRIIDFLTAINLQSRYNPRNLSELNSVEWGMVSSELSKLIESSKNFLRKSINYAVK